MTNEQICIGSHGADEVTRRFRALEQSFTGRLIERNAPARVGLLLLATDYTSELDWRHLCGDEIEFYCTRVDYLGKVSVDSLTQMEQHIVQAASLLVLDIDVDVLAFGCTSGSILIGEARIAELMTVARQGVAVTNPWTAAKAALRELGATRIAVLTPYASQINEVLYKSLQETGFEVAAFGAFHLNYDKEIYRVSGFNGRPSSRRG